MSDTTTQILPPVDSPAPDAVGKIRRRLIPFLCLLYVVNYLDRANVSMAKLQMLGDLRLTDRQFGLGAGLFFIGYFAFEVPSNLILQRVGARRWLARIMISWGIFSSMLALSRGPLSFYGIRFFLGLAEAGFYPGVVLYLTHWIPYRWRAGTMAAFLMSIGISGIVGNPLAGFLMKLDGIAGLHGWQWLFLLEGLPPVLLGIAILLWPILPERPADARWLPKEDAQWIIDRLADDDRVVGGRHISSIWQAVEDPRLAVLSLLYFLLVMGLYGFIFWTPSIVKNITGDTDATVGWLSAIPYVVATASMIFIGHFADGSGNSARWVAIYAAIGAVGMAAAGLVSGPVLGIAALCLAAIGIFGSLGPFWTIPTRYLRGSAAAAGFAVINSAGALAGFVAPYAIGWIKNRTGQFTWGLMVVAISLALGAVLALLEPSEKEI